MPDLTASIPHQQSRAEVKRRIQEHLGVVREQYAAFLSDLKENWIDDTMEFSLRAVGQSISGQLRVEDQAVHLTVSLPWFLHMIADAAKKRIEQQGRLLLTQHSPPAAAVSSSSL